MGSVRCRVEIARLRKERSAGCLQLRVQGRGGQEAPTNPTVGGGPGLHRSALCSRAARLSFARSPPRIQHPPTHAKAPARRFCGFISRLHPTGLDAQRAIMRISSSRSNDRCALLKRTVVLQVCSADCPGGARLRAGLKPPAAALVAAYADFASHPPTNITPVPPRAAWADPRSCPPGQHPNPTSFHHREPTHLSNTRSPGAS